MSEPVNTYYGATGFLMVKAADHDRVVRERDSLLAELSACKSPPGGCGYWRESARIREQERDTLRAEVERLRGLLSEVRGRFKTMPAGMPERIDAALSGSKE